MTKYLPKHLATRHGRVESARVGAAAARGSRSALALGVGATLPVAGAAVMAAPAFAAQETPAPAPAPTTSPVLTFDSRGEAVKTLQARLALVVDGWYGPVTTAAVKDFQRANRLDVDGVVGPRTWAALDASSAQPSAGDVVRRGELRPRQLADDAVGVQPVAALERLDRRQRRRAEDAVRVDLELRLDRLHRFPTGAEEQDGLDGRCGRTRRGRTRAGCGHRGRGRDEGSGGRDGERHPGSEAGSKSELRAHGALASPHVQGSMCTQVSSLSTVFAFQRTASPGWRRTPLPHPRQPPLTKVQASLCPSVS